MNLFTNHINKATSQPATKPVRKDNSILYFCGLTYATVKLAGIVAYYLVNRPATK